MAEPIRAIRHRDRREFRDAPQRGTFYVNECDDTGKSEAFWFCCPCGCGDFARIEVQTGQKPKTTPSWKWDGNLSDPTLEPSIMQLNCGWHGYLRAGYWEKL